MCKQSGGHPNTYYQQRLLNQISELLLLVTAPASIINTGLFRHCPKKESGTVHYGFSDLRVKGHMGTRRPGKAHKEQWGVTVLLHAGTIETIATTAPV